MDAIDAPIRPDRFLGHEVAAWHSPEWWRRHWELSGLVDGIEASW